MEDLIASKVDAIDLVATNGSGTVRAVESAARHGIPVINCNVMTDSNKVVTPHSLRRHGDRRMEADYMAKALNGKGNVVMLRGPAGTSWAQIRGDAFGSVLPRSRRESRFVGEQYSQSTPEEGMRLMEDFMQTYPRIDGVYNGADMTAVGANRQFWRPAKPARSSLPRDFQPDSEKFMREGVMSRQRRPADRRHRPLVHSCNRQFPGKASGPERALDSAASDH